MSVSAQGDRNEDGGLAAYDLERFVTAQAPVYGQVLDELRAGCKRTHWMWFIFPQLAGLGHSPTARYFAIASLAEARAYMRHPVLSPRLIECTSLTNAAAPASAHAIFASPDDLKFRSSMTLFRNASEAPAFAEALRLFFDGEEDRRTLELL